MDKIKFSNRYGAEVEMTDWFKFEYEIGWRFHSNEPMCFAGDAITVARNKSCKFWCAHDQCTLKSPENPNNDVRRMLKTSGRDIKSALFDDSARISTPKRNGKATLTRATAL